MKIALLLAWCSSNGINIDPRLQLREDDEGSFSVYAIDYIPHSETLVHISKAAVLSVKSCSVSHLLNATPYGYGAQLALALALHVELIKGPSSRWYGYLQSLPGETVDLPLFWGVEGLCEAAALQDGQLAQRWLRGTEVTKKLLKRTESGLPLLDELRRYYNEVATPVFSAYSLENPTGTPPPTLKAFCHAFSLVASRAFLVDAFHGLAMVPIADAFNHSQDNHVHLESEYDVCPQCGALFDCPHDPSISETPISEALLSIPSVSADRTIDDSYEMMCNAPIPPHAEVFNTYGGHLSNAELLLQYGFILDENENDCVGFEREDLERSMAGGGTTHDGRAGEALEGTVREVASRIPEDILELLVDSRLVYVEDETDEGKVEGRGTIINADGKLSLTTWVSIALVNRPGRDGAPSSDFNIIAGDLARLFRWQGRLEGLVEWDPAEAAPGQEAALEDLAAWARIAEMVIALCKARKEGTGLEGKGKGGGTDLVEILDELEVEAHMPRTRLAILQVMSERSILESCIAGWEEVLSVAYAHTYPGDVDMQTSSG